MSNAAPTSMHTAVGRTATRLTPSTTKYDTCQHYQAQDLCDSDSRVRAHGRRRVVGVNLCHTLELLPSVFVHRGEATERLKEPKLLSSCAGVAEYMQAEICTAHIQSAAVQCKSSCRTFAGSEISRKCKTCSMHAQLCSPFFGSLAQIHRISCLGRGVTHRNACFQPSHTFHAIGCAPLCQAAGAQMCQTERFQTTISDSGCSSPFPQCHSTTCLQTSFRSPAAGVKREP
jgi:hypothetical protein